MKLIVNDVEYDVTDSIQGAALGDLMKLKVKSKGAEFTGDPNFLGVTVKGIQDTFESVGDRAKDEAFSTIDLLGDLDFLVHMAGLIFLAKRQARESVEFADVLATRFDSFQLVPDADEIEDDEVVEDAPKVPSPQVDVNAATVE